VTGNEVTLEVIDSGIGIAEEDLPLVWERYYKVNDFHKRANVGTGLGLSIVKQLVELMDGDISVSSVYTQGSTFTVSLWQKISNPMAVGEIDIANYGSAASAGGYRESFTAPDARVLIVDDNEMNLEVEITHESENQIFHEVEIILEIQVILEMKILHDEVQIFN
jgi:hypothetical protein